MNKYVSFIKDEDLKKAIDDLYKVYDSTKEKMTDKDFYRNKIDPIKLLFDTKFNNRTIEETIDLEILRKKDKTISNAIGKFHEQLLGSIEGYNEYATGHGYDIKADDESLFADVKNKHNTVKGSNLKDLYRDLEKYAEESSNPDAKSYWVQIIAMSSFNEPWEIPIHDLKNPKVYKISADQLYALMTGEEEAFKNLCMALPQAIDDYLKEKDMQETKKNKVIENLKKNAQENNTDIITELFNETFDCYIGFPIKKPL